MPAKPQILHICADEKYMDGAIYLFEKAFPANNLFLVVTVTVNAAFRYIKSENVKFKKIALHKEIIAEILGVTAQFQVVVLHALNTITAEVVNRAGRGDKFIWVIMGAEVYENPLIYQKEIYGCRTREIKEKIDNTVDYIELLKKQYRKFRYGHYECKTNSNQLILSAAGKVGCFASLVQEEYDFLKSNNILADDAGFQHFSYYPIEYFANLNTNNGTIGKDILIGNSSNYTNNHLEVFTILKELNINTRKVYVPLSYGDMKYRKALIPIGKKMFGSQFVPVTEFMPLNKYHDMLRSCGIVIMNNYRQQAVGNIVAAIWQGSKVYLSEKNILYHFFNRIGCRVFSIEKDLVPANEEALKRLTECDVTQNKKVLEQYISERILVSKLREGFKALYNIG